MEKDKQMKIDLELAEAMRDELVKKCNTYTRRNKELESKISEIREEYETKLNEMQKSLDERNSDNEKLLKDLNNERIRANKVRGKMDDLWSFLSKAYNVLALSAKRRGDVDTHSAVTSADLIAIIFSRDFPDHFLFNVFPLK